MLQNMFLQDSKEGRKRGHINNICGRARKGPEGNRPEIRKESLKRERGPKKGRGCPREKTPIGKIQTGAGKGAAGKSRFVFLSLRPCILTVCIFKSSRIACLRTNGRPVGKNGTENVHVTHNQGDSEIITKQPERKYAGNHPSGHHG